MSTTMRNARVARAAAVGAGLELLEGRRLLSGGYKFSTPTPAPTGTKVHHHKAASTALFKTAVDFGVGHEPQGITVADFNRDGNPDLANTNFSDGTITVRLGNGAGSFAKGKYATAGANLSSIVSGDFNRDKIPDLAVVGDDLAILLGKGDGTFNAATHITLGNTPQAAVVGDFNGDGRPDLAVTNVLGDTVSVLLGIGGGQFQAPATYPAGQGPAGIVAADFNGDKKLDLAIADAGEGATGSGEGTSILLNNGDGTFHFTGTLSAVGRPEALAAADLNQDGKIDLAVVNGGFNSSDGQSDMSVFLGTGSGTFGNRADFNTGAGNPIGIVLGDVNLDGKPDAIVGNTSGLDVTLSRSPTPPL
jgi:hypothetical protein